MNLYRPVYKRIEDEVIASVRVGETLFHTLKADARHTTKGPYRLRAETVRKSL